MTIKKQKLLVVDDENANIFSTMACLGDDYTIHVATNGIDALDLAKAIRPDMILLDIVMPGMDGFDVCRHIKNDPILQDIAVIFVTALDDNNHEARGLELGAIDYLTKPLDAAIVKARIRNYLELRNHRMHLEELIKERTLELEHTQEAIVVSMALLAEFRDPETGGHIERTRHYVRTLAKALAVVYPNELSESNIELLSKSATLHDIGKVAINDSILFKAGRLTTEEFAEMKRHTLIGGEAIRRAETCIGPNSFLRMAREIAECHHERWDGTGYPHGLKKEEIPLSARIMAIADIYDALISERPYKPAFSHRQAYEIITKGDEYTLPEHFSPAILETFRAIQPIWVQIAATFT